MPMLVLIIWYLFLLVSTVYTCMDVCFCCCYVLQLQVLHFKSCCARLGLTQVTQCKDKSVYGRLFVFSVYVTFIIDTACQASSCAYFCMPFFSILSVFRVVMYGGDVTQTQSFCMCGCVARLLQLPATTFLYNFPLLPCTQKADGPVKLLCQLFS